MHRSLERRYAPDNIDRFYRLDLERDLFGIWCVTRNWGRSGTFGRRQVLSFASRDAASRAFQSIAAAKTRRGYVERP